MTLRHAALALALAGAAATAHAGVKASVVNPEYQSFTSPQEVFVILNAAGAVTLTFNLPSAGKKVLTFSAVCAVQAPGGDWYKNAHVDLDIYVNGLRAAPTAGTFPFADDAFCTHGVGPDGFGSLTRASITVPIQGNAGNNAVQIKARGQDGAQGFYLGRTSLVIYD